MEINLILACFIFFFYNYDIFTKISKATVKKIIVYIFMAFLNTFLMVFSYYSKIPYYISYFLSLLFLTIEFFIISKSKLSQAFLSAGILVLNISAIQIIFINLYSYFNNILPFEFFKIPSMFFEFISYLFLFLFLINKFTKKFIFGDDIIKISSTFQYFTIVSTLILFTLTYTIVDILIIQSPNYRFEIAPTFIFIPILTLIVFYNLLFYIFKSVRIEGFKRKSDELEIRKIKTIVNKKHMENKIYKDELTSCYNRKFIMYELEEREKQNISNFTVLFIDIDGLKYVNDNFGHKAGDEYILNISKILKKSIRKEDLIARIGGDEFLVILNEFDEMDIPKILKRIEIELSFINRLITEYKSSASIGYIYVDENLLKSGIDNIIKLADEKMRNIKITSKGEYK